MRNSSFRNTLVRSGYYYRDATSMLLSLPPRAIEVTITSPPYGGLKDYGTSNQVGYGQSYDEYLSSLSAIFRLLYTKTTETGSLWLVADTFRENSKLRLFPFDLATCLRAMGWHLQDVIVWNKTRTLPWSRPGQFRRTFEYILFFTKTSSFKYFISRIKEPTELKQWWVLYPERYNPEGRAPSTIWTFPIPVQGSWSSVRFRHFCPFPVGLVERILLLTTEPGDLVLDPFAGSGVVLAQAKAMRRRFLGCDVNRSYKDQFYRVITNHINDRWRNNKIVQKEMDAARARLAQTIRKLRLTKFPKALFREVKKVLGFSRLESVRLILCRASPIPRSSVLNSFSVSVHFVCDKKAPLHLIQNVARNRIQKPPLSKYGIVAEAHASSLDRFWKSRYARLLRKRRLFLYQEGNTHMFRREIHSAHWVELRCLRWRRFPPILTNVQVQQERVPSLGS